MNTPLNRITDIGIGPCEITVQITGIDTVITEHLIQSRLLDLHLWKCCTGKGIGINITASTVTFAGGLPAHRIMDLQMGCTIAVVVTGASKTISG